MCSSRVLALGTIECQRRADVAPPGIRSPSAKDAKISPVNTPKPHPSDDAATAAVAGDGAGDTLDERKSQILRAIVE